jgi:hypothetical protein
MGRFIKLKISDVTGANEVCCELERTLHYTKKVPVGSGFDYLRMYFATLVI